MCATAECRHNFWRGVGETEAQARGFAGARRAAEVDYGPAVLPRQPHHVPGLEITVHVTQRVERRHAERQLMHHLHQCFP